MGQERRRKARPRDPLLWRCHRWNVTLCVELSYGVTCTSTQELSGTPSTQRHPPPAPWLVSKQEGPHSELTDSEERTSIPLYQDERAPILTRLSKPQVRRSTTRASPFGK